MLLCPTFAPNRTFDGCADKDPNIFVVACQHNEVERWLKLANVFFRGHEPTHDLGRLCVEGREFKERTNRLVSLDLSGRHTGISVWALTKQITSIAKPFRENAVNIVVFYTPSSKTTKVNFEDYAGELLVEDYKEFIGQLKKLKFSHLVFSLRYPYRIELIFVASEKL